MACYAVTYESDYGCSVELVDANSVEDAERIFLEGLSVGTTILEIERCV